MSEDLDLDINKDRLDEEWVRQVRMYGHFAPLLADARRDHSRAETETKLVEAELDREVRLHPEDHGAVCGHRGVTESVVEMAIRRNKRYKLAQRAEIEAKHSLDVLQLTVSRLDARKYALQDLVRLRLADYFSDSMPKDVREHSSKAERDSAFSRKGGKR